MTQTMQSLLVGFIFFMSALTLLGTWKRPNRYGRYMRDGQPRTVPALAGWLLFESPQLCAFALAFWLTASDPSPVAVGLFVVWQAHYVHRAVLYPLRRNDKGKRFPVGGVVAGVLFNSINGVINGWAVVHAEHLMSTGWLTDGRFIVGAISFVIGWGINFQADSILIGLRGDGSTGYKIPYGGAFRWVSAANYFGEIVMWTGWAVMTWTAAGLSFAAFTTANLLPRALSHHRWYRKTFPAYPPERRAVFPWLL